MEESEAKNMLMEFLQIKLTTYISELQILQAMLLEPGADLGNPNEYSEIQATFIAAALKDLLGNRLEEALKEATQKEEAVNENID